MCTSCFTKHHNLSVIGFELFHRWITAEWLVWRISADAKFGFEMCFPHFLFLVLTVTIIYISQYLGFA